ncbi:hypothetical protein ZWY2020_031888 [Hordeum vulgare]|nr:hypothetical protein ZWY2020_031888 [Hordeum vulgare]
MAASLKRRTRRRTSWAHAQVKEATLAALASPSVAPHYVPPSVVHFRALPHAVTAARGDEKDDAMLFARENGAQLKKESECELTKESISNATGTNEQLRRLVLDQRARRDEFAEVMAHQLQGKRITTI